MDTTAAGNGGDSHPADSTAILLDRARSGDDQALNALVTRYRLPLTRWASGRLPARARGPVDTEDLVQDALVQCLKRLDGFESRWKGAFHGYLRRAVLNRLRDQVRRAEFRERAHERNSLNPVAETSPLENVIGLDALNRYEAALAGLDAADRELIVARLELNLSYEELATQHDKPSADAARMAVKRALLRLARGMGESADG